MSEPEADVTADSIVGDIVRALLECDSYEALRCRLRVIVAKIDGTGADEDLKP